jgi:hypothetical protein
VGGGLWLLSVAAEMLLDRGHAEIPAGISTAKRPASRHSSAGLGPNPR